MAQAPVFKAGDTFILPVWLHDADPSLNIPMNDPSRGISIGAGYTFECQIKSMNDQSLIASLTCTPYANQVAQKGWVLLKSEGETKGWKRGLAQMDIKVTLEGVTKHSASFEFYIIDGVTA
ncbi:hypothetical protein [Acinetobacter radioresistens]|uniref:hypothetical protein n=1 Tax=Acinetobacter radioresistens TaxID=40216 RepID=UPI000946242C|nr:hypothetical protein [Acinetobacter radioresistens]